MKDIFNDFVSYGIYKFEDITTPPLPGKKGNIENYIKLELSSDQFNNFCTNLAKTTINKEIDATIYDERIINDYYDRQSIQRLIKKLNSLNFRKINFILSDSTLPEYNHLMNTLAWKHKSKTTITMKIDRNPISEEVRNWNLSEAQGTLNIPEEKLMWIPNNELYRLKGIINDKVLHDSLKLKDVILYLDNYLRETYHLEYMNKYEKTLAVYKFLKLYIRFPHKYIDIINEREILKPNHPSYISEPYGTWINKEGVCEGQARLMTILLNNPLIKIDATTIEGEVPQGRHTWVGIVLNNKLYQCCTTMQGPFKNLDKLGYKIDEPIEGKQIYPLVFEHAYLTDEEINKIERKLKVLKR